MTTSADVGPVTTRRIVVGIDGSDGAQSALDWAVNEARMRGDSVDAVSAWTVPPLAYLATSTGPSSFSEDLHDAAEQVLARALGSIARPSDVAVRPLVVEGPASTVLLEAAKDADLLVVGTRGRGGFAGLLLGSTSHHVAHHATCPVVIVAAEPAA